jgi:predicted transcriptional regulator with HTH domain
MSSIIPDRAEFIDALRALRNGHVLVRVHGGSSGCLLDGATVYRSFQTLLAYGLIRAFDNREGFAHVQYYRITESGREFAERACEWWQRRPLLERLAVRFAG